MDILLYQFSGDGRTLDKSLANPLTKSITIRSDIDLYNPMLLLSSFDASYNYFKLFDSYYFITSVHYTAQGVWRVQSHIDVLMTYKDYILQANATLARSARHGVYLQGAGIPMTAKPSYRQDVFPNKPFTRNNDNYILIGMGGKAD